MEDYYFDETLVLMHIASEINKLPDDEESTDATLNDLLEMGFSVTKG